MKQRQHGENQHAWLDLTLQKLFPQLGESDLKCISEHFFDTVDYKKKDSNVAYTVCLKDLLGKHN